MTEVDLANALIVVQPVLTPISDQEIQAALQPAHFSMSTLVHRSTQENLKLAELADADWPRLHNELLTEDDALQAALAASSGPVVYFGMAPIPLAIELGMRIGGTRTIRAFQKHHETGSWAWPKQQRSVALKPPTWPQDDSPAKGDVVIRVSCSHVVSVPDTRRCVPFPIGEIAIELTDTDEDAIESEEDLTFIAARFGAALDVVTRHFPHCDTVHLFAAVPAALALRMGAEINRTLHGRRIQTYQFADGREPRYLPALVVGHAQRATLTDEDRAVAADTRRAFARGLDALRAFAGTISTTGNWLAPFLGEQAAAFFDGAIVELGPLGRTQAIAEATISEATAVDNGEFRFDRATRTWLLDDRLLVGLGRRLQGTAVERAARAFFFHEAVHIERQDLTSENAVRVGRLPRVLEELDYLADVWALLHEHAFAVRSAQVTEDGAPAFFTDLLSAMTSTFWAFDDGTRPLRYIPVRRLNRYLIWYWQRLAFERATNIVDIARLLSRKPVLELAGPRVTLDDGRVVFDLDPAYFDQLELGFVADGYRLVRAGSHPGARLRDLVNAVRHRNETRLLDALRSVADSARGGT